MPLRYYPRGFRAIVLRAICWGEGNEDTGPDVVKLLKILEERCDCRGPDHAFKTDPVTGQFFAPAIVLWSLCEEHTRDSAVFNVCAPMNGDPDLHSGAVGR